MKNHILICLFIFVLVGKKKGEIIRLGNEIITLENVSRII